MPVTAPAATTSKKDRQLGDRALRVGSTGTDVKLLQGLLREVGLKTSIDGTFGADTKAAVQKFQRAVRLEPSGTVGPKTVKALKRAASGDPAAYGAGGATYGSAPRARALGDRIPLQAGMSGGDVKDLQTNLRKLRVKVSVDGEFGAGTAKAVRAFERQSGLPSDGVVDANDIEALRQQVAPEPTKSSAPAQLAPGDRAKLGPDGLAIAPEDAPEAVKAIIAAGNEIAKLPYKYGGGHAKEKDTGYDCSGSVSYALREAGLMKGSMVSGAFPSWGDSGPGDWVTIYGNGGHVYMVVAGLRFDTSGAKQTGSRWQTASRSSKGFGVSHPKGL